jgi:hypothetical protein
MSAILLLWILLLFSVLLPVQDGRMLLVTLHSRSQSAATSHQLLLLLLMSPVQAGRMLLSHCKIRSQLTVARGGHCKQMSTILLLLLLLLHVCRLAACCCYAARLPRSRGELSHQLPPGTAPSHLAPGAAFES